MIFNDDKYTDQQKRCIPDVSFELIPIRNLVSNQEYQRPLSEGHIRRALEEFDVYQINPVKVSRRDGINYVFDGQHTIEIVATESGSRDTPVWCMVYDDLKYTEEAHIFADQQKHVKNLVPYETFKAHIEAGDEKQKMIETTVQSYGLFITSSNQPNGIAAVSTLEKIYDKFGQNVLDTTLRLAVQTWEGESNSLSGNILMGIARIVVAYGEFKDRTIEEIQDACRNHMNAFIDHLLSLQAVSSDHMVLYMCEASSFDRNFNHEDKTLNLTDINEIRQDINASSYASEFTDWSEALGYLVADNKLTQDYLYELLSQFLNELSFFGADPGEHQKNVKKAHAELDQAMKEVKAGHTIPAEQVFKELAEEHGFPVDEKDEYMDELRSDIRAAQYKYSRYCHWRERSRILESIGEAAVSFEES